MPLGKFRGAETKRIIVFLTLKSNIVAARERERLFVMKDFLFVCLFVFVRSRKPNVIQNFVQCQAQPRIDAQHILHKVNAFRGQVREPPIFDEELT